MATVGKENRATELAAKAVEFVSYGKTEEASRALREAINLAPENKSVKEAFDSIQTNQNTQPLLKLCLKFTTENDTAAGKEALQYLSSENATLVTGQVAEKSLRSIIEVIGASPTIRDELVASFIQHCLVARIYVANRLQDSASVLFDEIFSIGNGAANAITVVSLDPIAWPNESVRLSHEKDVFLLFLAKLLESGHDNDGRALKGISRHLAVDAERLQIQVDEESFDAILSCLDYRLSQDIRGQATLATAKYLEASKKTGEEYLTRFITTRTAKHASEDLVLAFSVAAAVFPIATPLISALFLVEGFLPSLIPLLDKKSRPIKVEKAALDMLSAACVDSGCREAIAKYCWDWMHHVMEDEADVRHGQAALILAKVQSQTQEKNTDSQPTQRRSSKEIADVVPILKSMLTQGTEIDRRTGIEGLAYASVQASVKDEIIRDNALLARLLELPRKDSVSPTTAFGSLNTLDNLTRYLPNLSEEQERMSELKAYANASKSPPKPHPLDQDEHVTTRCKRLLDAHLVPYLVTLKNLAVNPPLSAASLQLIAKIVLSLSKAPTHRGMLAQQGSIPLLLQIYGSTVVDTISKQYSAHALARILISTDPALIRSYTNACINPLLTLLNPDLAYDSDQPRDLLPTFEALLAITNLVSDPSLATGEAVISAAFSRIEDLLLHSNPVIQRAATELVCNLTLTASGLEKFADGSPAAFRRLHILLALADSEDAATRRAAGGALAGITEFPDAVSAVLKRDGGVDRLLDLCRDGDAGCVHRGAVCVKNLVSCGGPAGEEARRVVRERGGVEVLKGMVSGKMDAAVAEVVLETVRVLVQKR